MNIINEWKCSHQPHTHRTLLYVCAVPLLHCCQQKYMQFLYWMLNICNWKLSFAIHFTWIMNKFAGVVCCIFTTVHSIFENKNRACWRCFLRSISVRGSWYTAIIRDDLVIQPKRSYKIQAGTKVFTCIMRVFYLLFCFSGILRCSAAPSSVHSTIAPLFALRHQMEEPH